MYLKKYLCLINQRTKVFCSIFRVFRSRLLNLMRSEWNTPFERENIKFWLPDYWAKNRLVKKLSKWTLGTILAQWRRFISNDCASSDAYRVSLKSICVWSTKEQKSFVRFLEFSDQDYWIWWKVSEIHHLKVEHSKFWLHQIIGHRHRLVEKFRKP